MDPPELELCPSCGWALEGLVHRTTCAPEDPSKPPRPVVVRAWRGGSDEKAVVLPSKPGSRGVKTGFKTPRKTVALPIKTPSRGGRPRSASREDVLALLEGGLTQAATAQALGVSVSTVRRRMGRKG